MGIESVGPWHLGFERLDHCFGRIEKAANADGQQMRGNASESRPYRFNREQSFFDAVDIVVSFEHESDDYLRYSVRIEERTSPRRPLAVGPTGLIDVRDGFAGRPERSTPPSARSLRSWIPTCGSSRVRTLPARRA